MPTGKPKIRKFENGFQIEDLAMGQPDGPLAKPGQKVFVKYRGSLTNGKVFDETKGKSTFGFRLGMAAPPFLQTTAATVQPTHAPVCVWILAAFTAVEKPASSWVMCIRLSSFSVS